MFVLKKMDSRLRGSARFRTTPDKPWISILHRGAVLQYSWYNKSLMFGPQVYHITRRFGMNQSLKKLMAKIMAYFSFRLVRAPKRAILEDPDGNLDLRLEFIVFHHLESIADRPFQIVQIGAFDGKSYDDAVHQFFSDPRFQGLLVEPQPLIFERLQQTYSGNDQVILENAAIANIDGQLDLYAVDTSRPELPEWLDGCASFSKEVVLKYEDRFPTLPDHIVTLVVPCMTLTSLLEKYQVQQIDLLQIDVEGYDYEVIKMVDLENNKPAIIRFERAHLSESDLEECYDLLFDHGYKIALDGIDVMAYIG